MLGVVGTRTLPRRHRQAIARVAVSALVASLPLLYVSLLRPPPAALAGDTAFWFLMSNCVIAAIVATADDAGTLFFGSSSNDDDPCNGDAVVPLAAVDDPAVVTMRGGGVQEEVAGSNPVDLAASPFLTQAESGDAANRAGTGLQPNHMHVSVLLQRGEQHEAPMEPGTDDKDSTAVTMVMRGQGDEDGEIASPTPASDRALAEPQEAEPEPEPWVPKLVTSKSLPDQEVQEEEEAADEEWPVALYSRPPDVLAHGKGGRLRRSATDGSKSAAEESEYWQLSDEELNRRVEDFIARFNRQMRLQIEQEADV
ncbi:unnamed protein product [Miscanthus lutarioriparius]|uniref:Uncharacterized protein n=1 Tax=Miscanthus lutarioriparius TaxID=422564 RepID=A0A811MKY3_9POAL|nr:unnamed protein product [Miscanthus lutarioriparius]